jgi:nucleoside-diphosphate-sugar epimerase
MALRTLLGELFDCCRFPQVEHLAAHAGVRKPVQEPAQYVSSYAEATVLLLEAMRRQSWPV